MAKNPIPKYLFHKSSGQAYVRVPLAGGGRRTVYLGKFNSEESKEAYRRILADLSRNNGQDRPGCRDAMTVNALMVRFLEHAMMHYRRADGTPTHEIASYKAACRVVKSLYGTTLASEFGPLRLKAVRDEMIKKGWVKTRINQQIGRVRRMFKWAASEELVPPCVHHGLATVTGLAKGRTAAAESDPVEPVQDEHVKKTLEHLPRQVAGLVRFCRLTGCRPGEACNLKHSEIDRTGPVWFYRPTYHKLSHRGTARVIPLGPQAQRLLAQFPPFADEEHVFTPAAAKAEHAAERRAARKTRLYPSHLRRYAKQRTTDVKSEPSKYGVVAFGRAVARAAVLAGVPHWHPNQLRHTFASAVRARFGLEAAQVCLGHARADVTQIYAEKNQALGATVAADIG
jgi:integrase